MPATLQPFTRVYLMGSFNGWIGADSALVLEEDGNHVFYAEVDLPEGDSIEYAYALGYGSNRPVIQESYSSGDGHQYRGLAVSEGVVQRDSVAKWISGAVHRGSWQLQDIGRIQEKFLIHRFRGYTHKPRTVSDLDALFEAAEAAWAQEARSFFPGFEDLTSSAYLYMLAAQKSESNSFSRSIGCHMFAGYQLPAYQRELEYARKQVSAEKAGLISSGRSIIQVIYCDDLSDESWHALEATYRALPSLLDTYLALTDLPPLTRKDFEDFQDMLAGLRLDFDFASACLNGDLDRASRLMTVAFLDPTRKRAFSVYLARELAERLADRGEMTEALKVLDFAAQKTTTYEVSTDTLRSWYGAIGGAEGLRRFQQLAATISRDSLAGQGDPIEWSGTYIDLTSGTAFDLSTLKGKTVLIDFWTTWCGPCIQEIPDLIAFQERIEDREDIVFISVSEDAVDEAGTPKSELEEFIAAKGINYVVLYDSPENPISRHFDVKGYPTKYLLDASGRIVSGTAGLFSVLRD